MSEPHDRLCHLAEAVADGTPVDWAAAESVVRDEAELRRIGLLRIIDRVAAFHADGLAAHESGSIRTEQESIAAGPLQGVPRQWGPLRVLEHIGRGTFGDVYRAWDTRLQREVALKLLRRSPRSGPASADAAVVEEGRMMARVRHPGVAVVYGAERLDGRTGVWMEFISGRTLEEELAALGPLDAAGLREVGVAVAHALEAVHRAGLLHRDVKLPNIMREHSGRLVLMDFGTGGDIEGPIDCRRLAGTPLYLAPEVLAGQPATQQSDLYSLGVALFRLATGAYPVEGTSLRVIQSAHERGGRRSLAEARPDLPADVVRVVDRLLAVDVVERYHAAAAVAGDLAARGPATGVWAGYPRAVWAFGGALLALTSALVWTLAPPGQALAGPGSWVHLESVTLGTTSTLARQLVAQAEELMQSVGTPASQTSESLLGQALIADPDFAYAHVLRAWTLRGQGRRDEALQAAERARVFAEDAPEVDRLFVAASYQEMRAATEPDADARRRWLTGAVPIYESLLDRRPGHPWAAGNLLSLYRELGPSDRALAFVTRAAELRPANFNFLVQASIEAMRAGRLDLSAHYAGRARERLDTADRTLLAPYAAWIRLFPAHHAWLSGDARRALAATDRAALERDTLELPEKLQLMRLVSLYVSLGRFRRAQALAREIPDAVQAVEAEATAIAERGDPEGLRRFVLAHFSNRRRAQAIASYVIDAGLFDLARQVVRDLQVDGRDRRRTEWAAGLLAAAEGDHERAIELLEPVVRDHPFPASSVALKGAIALASARRAQGSLDRAIAILERASAHRASVPVLWSAGYAWIAMRERLAAFYRESGRRIDAHAIEAELLALRAAAD